MKMKRKNLLAGVVIAAAVMLAASIILRVVLTKERLAAMVVPRLERAVEAKIEIGDIGIRFPFGFGVDIGDIAFEKELPGGSTIRFDSDRITVDASLISLIRRNPEIKKVHIRGGTVRSASVENGLDLALNGVEAGVSIIPDLGSYNIDADLSMSDLEAVRRGRDGVFRIEQVSASFKARSDRGFDSLQVVEAAVKVGGLIKLVASGEVKRLDTEKLLSMRLVSDKIDAAPLLDWFSGLDLRPFMKGEEGTEKAAGLPAEIKDGKISFSGDIEGSAATPGDIAIKGSVLLERLTLQPAEVPLPVVIDGAMIVTKKEISSEKLTASSGRSSAVTGFTVKLPGEGQPGRADFSCRIDLDAAELSGNMPDMQIAGTGGKIRAELRGGAAAGLLASLFPAEGSVSSPETISSSWKALDLEGSIEIEGAGMTSPDGLVAISGLQGSAKIRKGDLKDIDASFILNGRPFRAKASAAGIMQAASELRWIGEKGAAKGLSGILDSLGNRPKVSAEVSGRALDLRPFSRYSKEQKKASENGDRDKKDKPAGKNPAEGLLLFLFDTRASVRVDTVYAEKALLTAVSGTGTISRGKALIDPLTFDYAGGKGTGTASADLRDPNDVRSKFKIAFSGVQAKSALTPLHSMGSLVSGEFSLETEGELLSGPDIDLLKTISVLGRASSTSGKIDLSRFISPVSKTAGFDLSAIEKSDFKNWVGNFRIEKGRLSTDDWRIDSSGGNWDIRGSFGFDGTLDYKARLLLTPQMQKKIKDLDKYRDIVDLFRDDAGNLILDLVISGDSRSPSVGIDRTRAEKKAGEKLLDGIKKGIGDLFKKE